MNRFCVAVVALVVALSGAAFAAPPQPPGVVLGRPTDSAVSLSILSSDDVELFVEYGDAIDALASTSIHSLRAATPLELTLDALAADHDYVYRLRYRSKGESGFAVGELRRFHTQRGRGATFTFAVEADPHLDPNASDELFVRSLDNISLFRPDFLVDLGDTFMSEKIAPTRQLSLERYKLLRSRFERLGHSVPLLLVPGNHEGEAGWLDDGTSDNMAVWTTTMRKQYFAGPEPDGFYTGDPTIYPFVGLRQAIYAFEWGDALFVMLDPFWNTPARGTGLWTWTLGREQYDWLENVLRETHCTFKFVFIHHLTGGLDASARGGIEAAPYFEWGGRSLDGRWDFDAKRPGWIKPIHQILVENGVTIVFHGHDHLYAMQELDGIVYQEVPQPAWAGKTSPDAASYGYLSGTIFPSSGNLRVTVAPDRVTIDYVAAVLAKDETASHRNGTITHSYVITAPASKPPRTRPVRR